MSLPRTRTDRAAFAAQWAEALVYADASYCFALDAAAPHVEGDAGGRPGQQGLGTDP